MPEAHKKKEKWKIICHDNTIQYNTIVDMDTHLFVYHCDDPVRVRVRDGVRV